MKNQNTTVIWKTWLPSSTRIKVRWNELDIHLASATTDLAPPPPFSTSPLLQPHRRSLPFTFEPTDGTLSKESLDMPVPLQL